jgi:hypothetical protein
MKTQRVSTRANTCFGALGPPERGAQPPRRDRPEPRAANGDNTRHTKHIPCSPVAYDHRDARARGRCRTLASPCTPNDAPCPVASGASRGRWMAIGGTPTRGYAGGNEEHRIVSSSTTLRRICKPVVRARRNAVGGQYARDRFAKENPRARDTTRTHRSRGRARSRESAASTRGPSHASHRRARTPMVSTSAL